MALLYYKKKDSPPPASPSSRSAGPSAAVHSPAAAAGVRWCPSAGDTSDACLSPDNKNTRQRLLEAQDRVGNASKSRKTKEEWVQDRETGKRISKSVRPATLHGKKTLKGENVRSQNVLANECSDFECHL